MQAGGLVGGRGGRTAGAQATRGVRSQGHQRGQLKGSCRGSEPPNPAVVADDVILEAGMAASSQAGGKAAPVSLGGRVGGWVG